MASVPSPVTHLPQRERGCGCSPCSGSIEICSALAVAGDEGLEAAGLDEPGRSDCIPGQASCLARSPEAQGKAGVSRSRVPAFAIGVRKIQIVLQSNLRWPGHGSACLAGMRQWGEEGERLCFGCKSNGGMCIVDSCRNRGHQPCCCSPRPRPWNKAQHFPAAMISITL